MKKKNIIICIIVVVIVLGGSVAYGVIHRNNEVKAEQLERQKLEEQIEKEKKALKSAELAVDTAYKTRSDEDIDKANEAIEKLNDNQKTDKTKFTDRMEKLNGFLKLISDVDEAIAKATESKSDADINAAQSLIDKETDEYLKNDKLSAQKRLDELKAQITKEKEKQKLDAENKAKAAKAAQAQQTAQNEANQQAQTDEAAQQNQASNQQAYQEQPQQQYQEPANQSPAQPNYTQPAPAQPTPSQPTPSTPAPSAPAGGGGNNLPAGPTQGGGSNGAGIENSPGGNDGIGEIEWEH